MKKLAFFLIPIFLTLFLIKAVKAETGEILIDGFENVETREIEYCYKNLIGVCSGGTRSYLRVKNWFPFTDLNYSRVKDFGKSLTDFRTQGSYSFALWWIPPSDCFPVGYTEDNPWHVICGESNTGTGGFMYRNISLNHTNYKLKLDIAPCNFYPVKCSGWWCQEEYYGKKKVDETPIKIDVYLKISIYEEGQLKWSYSAFWDSSLPENASFKTLEIDLRRILSTGNFTFYLEILPPSMEWEFPVCAVFDNLRAEEIKVVPPPAINYYNDMTTLIYPELPVINTTRGCSAGWYWNNSEDNLQSRYYNGVALFGFDFEGYYGSTGVLTCSNILNAIIVKYKNGSVVNIPTTQHVRVYKPPRPGYWWRYVYWIPIPDYEKGVKEIDLNFTGGEIKFWFNITFDDTYPIYRNKYPRNLTGTYETIIGNPYLYPLIFFNFSMDERKNITYYVASLGKGYTGEFEFTLRDKNGNIKVTKKETLSLAGGIGIFGPFYTDFLTKVGAEIETGDYIMVEQKTGIDPAFGSTKTYFYPERLPPEIVCESECIGTTYYLRRLIGEVCLTWVIPNYYLCIVAPPPVPPVPPEQLTPIPFVNATELREKGFGFLLPFLTPLAFTMFIIIGISGYVEYQISKAGGGTRGIAFAITFISLVLITSIMGLLPVWIVWLLIILAAGIVALFIRKLVSGE